MEPILTISISAAASLFIGIFAAVATFRRKMRTEGKLLIQKAEIEAEDIKNKKKLEAKEHFLKLKQHACPPRPARRPRPCPSRYRASP